MEEVPSTFPNPSKYNQPRLQKLPPPYTVALKTIHKLEGHKVQPIGSSLRFCYKERPNYPPTNEISTLTFLYQNITPPPCPTFMNGLRAKAFSPS